MRTGDHRAIAVAARKGDGLLDAYRKFKSLLRRPIWLTAEGVDAQSDAPTEGVDDTVVREAPDTSHVAPPIPEPALPRDEALELLARRVEVVASRADRLERSVESLSPVRVSELPTRAEYRGIEERVEANRKRGEELKTHIDELIEAYHHASEVHAADHKLMTELADGRARLDERMRDLAEEIADLRLSSASAAESMEALREALDERDQFQNLALTRRLAGAYTMAMVALLAALITLALRIFG